MEQPLISIISPTYNHSPYIIECIKSVQAQTYQNWEMLIINDGSTDNTFEIANEYIQQSGDNRIKLFNQQNIGIFRLAETYNFALRKSQGKYIAILECDDLWTPEKLERQVKVMEENRDIILAWGASCAVKNDLSINYGLYPTQDIEKSKYYNNNPIGSILNILFFENYIGALTILIPKSALLEIGGFIQSFNLPLVDLPTIMALAIKGKFHFDTFDYGTWRVSSFQVTKTYPVEIIKGRYALSLEYYKKAHGQNLTSITVTEKEIHRYFNKILLIAYARSGRYKLIRKDFNGARKDYVKTIFYKGFKQPIWRIRAIIGWCHSLLRKDVEWMAGIMGKTTYK